MFKVIISFKEESLDTNGKILLYYLRRQMQADMTFYPNHDGYTYLTIYERKKKNPKNWLSLDVHMSRPDLPSAFLHLDCSFSVDMSERDMVMRIQWNGEEAMNNIGKRLQDHCAKTGHMPWLNSSKWLSGIEANKQYPDHKNEGKPEVNMFLAASGYPFTFSRVRILQPPDVVPFHPTLFYKPDLEKFLSEKKTLEQLLAR